MASADAAINTPATTARRGGRATIGTRRTTHNAPTVTVPPTAAKTTGHCPLSVLVCPTAMKKTAKPAPARTAEEISSRSASDRTLSSRRKASAGMANSARAIPAHRPPDSETPVIRSTVTGTNAVVSAARGATTLIRPPARARKNTMYAAPAAVPPSRPKSTSPPCSCFQPIANAHIGSSTRLVSCDTKPTWSVSCRADALPPR